MAIQPGSNSVGYPAAGNLPRARACSQPCQSSALWRGLRVASWISAWLVGFGSARAVVAEQHVRLEAKEGRVVVYFGDELFTNYIYHGYEKPILYPIVGPHGIRMTRNWPMDEGFKDEEKDHPHHKSIWFGHMKVNDSSFWHQFEKAGKTIPQQVTVEGSTIKTTNHLVSATGELVAKDDREISFSIAGESRMIDYSVTYHATQGDITFGDDKDGQMGIRMHPALRLEGPVAVGQAINSEGVGSAEIWGKRAKWIDYWGEVEGKTIGIAIFDHPSNLRHPTWWHAREYGLVSANPFGMHYFEGKEVGAGNYTLPQGESLTFKHRFVFHTGDSLAAGIEQIYQGWIGE